MSAGVHGYGTVLKVHEGTNVAYTTIGNITSISGPDQSRDSIDISTMDSTNKFREFLPGMIDAGELTAELNYDSSSGGVASSLDTLARSTATNLNWVIEFNDGETPSSFECAGHITRLGYAIPFDDKVTQSVTIKLSGEPTYTDLT